MKGERVVAAPLPDVVANTVEVQTKAIAEAYRDPSPLGDKGLIASAALLSAPAWTRLPANASEKEQRAEVAKLLTNLPEGARKTAANADQLFGDTASTLRSVLNEGAVSRFERFTQVAAQEATQTFKAEDGTEKFYSPSAVAELANATVATEYQRSLRLGPAKTSPPKP